MVAARAAIVAEMPNVRGGVGVGRAAADAVLRVGRVLHGRPGHARVVETERDAARVRLANHRELRVVGVVDKPSVRGQSGHRLPPALGDELEFAVPVELVAEEVAEANRSRPQAPQELRQGALVHLEQPEIGIPGAQQRGRYSRDEIRAGTVVREPVPRTEDLGRHRGRRRLAVRRRDDSGSRRQSRSEAVDRVAVELREELARDRRPTAGSETARKRRHAARGCDLEREWGTHRASVVKTRLHGTICEFLNLLYTY